ncbi:MAG TPA: sulfite exporter TauE/SafE family protein [Gemmatimonadaceae bacterium]|nr:sulfite exporter TauE/SafE family protein [Gemmatimonadaceae bacterium]
MIVFIAIGLAAGVLAGLFGIGGGIVIGPALILLRGFSPQLAVGTSLGALLLPVGALGAWEYYRRGNLNVTAALWIALGLLLGAWVGARLAQTMSGPALQKSFAVFLVLIAIRVWVKA